jgi:response regulator RpfG family c-di-GMP phosphodiesterase/HAMP domain-containing protein
VALLPEVRRGVASEECNRALAVRLQQEPNLINILLALANGDVICHAIPSAQRISIADRDFFKAAIQTRTFSTGDYVISRTLGRPGIGFAYPVLDEAGVPRTVVAATLSLAWLKQELAKAQLPEGSRVVVVDGEGLVLGRHPDPQAWVGKRAAGLPLLRSILAKGGEGTEEAIGLDGLPQIFGFVPLHRTASGQTYLSVAIPKDVVVGPAERAFVVSLLVALALLVLTFGAVWLGSESLFVRRIAALTGAAKELGKGNLATRVGFKASGDEIGQLAQSFDRMAEGLQTKETQLSRANRALRTLSACNEALIDAVSESALLDTVCRLIVDAGGYALAWVGFVEQDPAKIVRVVAHYGSDEEYMESMNITWADAERGRGPTGTAIRTGATQVNQSFLTNPNMAPWREAALARGFQSSIAMPLKGPSDTVGSLTIYARERDAFNEDEVHLLEELAGDLAFGITTLRTRVERDRMTYEHLHHEEILRKSLEESIQAIANTLDMRDPYTAGHQRRVAQLAVAIANDLGLPKDEIHGIQLAAGIHDLGKIRIPAELLSRPGKLTDIEFALIKTHAQAGYDILKGIEFPWPIANIVLQHHERLDGSGYPQGLKEDQILLGSRILAVADVLETMASHRPYRPALGIDLALREIERGRGTAFDPAVVDACLKLFREGRFAFQG